MSTSLLYVHVTVIVAWKDHIVYLYHPIIIFKFLTYILVIKIFNVANEIKSKTYAISIYRFQFILNAKN